MRNLTIRREKRFVACLGTMKVYIEDPESNDMTINGCSCRKLGTLKNGEEKTFQISENAARVFVIGDKLSKGFCSEFYPLPAGQENILLTGKNCYNPATGNAFRFDGVTDESVLQNRKKGVRIGIVVLIVAAIVGFIIGYAVTSGLLGKSGEPKEFAVDELRITLTDEFSKQSAAGYTAGFGSSDVAVLVLQENFSQAEGLDQLSLKEYGNLVLQNNGKNATLKTENGVTYFEYDGTNGKDTYHYIATMFKGPDAFWLIQFATKDTDAAEFRDEIFAWAQTVTFE